MILDAITGMSERRHGRSMDPAGGLSESLRKKMSASQFRRYSEHMANATQNDDVAEALRRTKEKKAFELYEQEHYTPIERG